MQWRTWPQEKPAGAGSYVGRSGNELRWIYLDPKDAERIFYFIDADHNLPLEQRSTMTFQWLDESDLADATVYGIHTS